MNTPFLSVQDVAKLFGRAEKWVYRHKAEIPGFFKLAGSIFFDRETLLNHISELARKSAKRERPASPLDRHGLIS